jgi:hypothetical protein
MLGMSGGAMAVPVACLVQDDNLAGKACPCAAGYVCNDDAGICVAIGSPPVDDSGEGAALHDASKGYCASLMQDAALCADFDESPVFGGWDGAAFTATGGGTALLDKMLYVSAPNSMMITFDFDGGSIATANLTRNFGTVSFAQAKLVFSFRSASYLGYTNFVSVYVGHASYSLVLYENEVQLQQFLPDGGPGMLTPIAAFSGDAGWVPVTMTLQPNMPTSIRVTYGDAGATLDASVTATGPLVVDLGSTYTLDTASGWSAEYDNVVVTFQ